MKRKSKLILGIIFGILLILLISVFIYLSTSSKSLVSINDYKNLNPEINVEQTDDGILIDNQNTTTMLVFYPGAKIEASSYLPLLYKISESSIDCFIVEMPFNLAIFKADAFDSIYNQYNESTWFLMGHSLGGAMAARYASENMDKLDGLILLAAYSDQPIENLPVLSIYGSLDGVLNTQVYNENKKNLPQNYSEVIINGGNHANFGNYGYQKGDGTAKISREEQQQETAETVIDFIQLNN